MDFSFLNILTVINSAGLTLLLALVFAIIGEQIYMRRKTPKYRRLMEGIAKKNIFPLELHDKAQLGDEDAIEAIQEWTAIAVYFADMQEDSAELGGDSNQSGKE